MCAMNAGITTIQTLYVALPRPLTFLLKSMLNNLIYNKEIAYLIYNRDYQICNKLQIECIVIYYINRHQSIKYNHLNYLGRYLNINIPSGCIGIRANIMGFVNNRIGHILI